MINIALNSSKSDIGNTVLTSTIRGALSKLGTGAKLINATSNKKHTQIWKAGRVGAELPSTFNEEQKVPFAKGERVLFVQRGSKFYYYNGEVSVWYEADSSKIKEHFDLEDSKRSNFIEPFVINYDDLTKISLNLYKDEYDKLKAQIVKSRTGGGGIGLSNELALKNHCLSKLQNAIKKSAHYTWDYPRRRAFLIHPRSMEFSEAVAGYAKNSKGVKEATPLIKAIIGL